ncbi:MAG: rod shape-determining protein [Clostridia bacterium]|nr:rod shape-determining protein [Clostridia bacterium]
MGFSFITKDMGIDLGTANTLVYIKDKGIVLNEPSVAARDNYLKRIIATGQKAKDMLGKAPSSISVVRPLQEGVISDFDMAAAMLESFINRALENRGGSKMRLRVVVGVPSGVTEVEKRAVEDVVRNMGAREVYILEEPMAAAIGAGLDVDEAEGCMICDIGGGTTDIAIIALGGIVASTSIRYAGDKFNEAVVAYMRKTYGLLIGEKTAEELKKGIGCAFVDLNELGYEDIKTMPARGRDLASGLPKTIDVTSKDMYLALEESVETIVDGVKSTIEKAPPEIAADIAIHGMVLSGGGGMLHNLDALIEMRTGMKVTVAENAFEAVAMGTGMSLGNLEKLKRYASNRKR